MAASSAICFLSTFIFCSIFISFIPLRVKGCNITSLVSEQLYNELFPHKDDIACPAKSFFSYQSFIDATKRFPEFGNKGSLKTRKREVAAFLAQVSHETRVGSPEATDGPYDWGLCIKEEVNPGGDHCEEMMNGQFLWPCSPVAYKGRGAMMLAWNFNYGLAGEALGVDILANPDAVSNKSVLAYETALWIWMTQPLMKSFNVSAPSCHDVMTGRYKLTQEDKAANRTVGYGLVSNIISTLLFLGRECGGYNDQLIKSRIGYYKRFASLFNVETGPNLDCFDQKAFEF